MATHRLGIVMHGVTGRMGLNQHLRRSIAALRADGGVVLGNGDRVMPDPLLLGRDESKLAAIGAETGDAYTTDYDAAIGSSEHALFFDAATTLMRPDLLARAIAAGKHLYCEKPVAASLADARMVAAQAERAGVKAGVVMDKLFLPGLIKLAALVSEGFFGRILSVRIDFGYWVFTGEGAPSNRPSWNYRKRDGGGIIFDMMAHWRYVLDRLVAPIRSVVCLGATHVQERWDEAGARYAADADDAAYALLQLDGGIVAQVNSSWCTRVNRDDLAIFQIDGTEGSAVAGLTWCRTQSLVDTPRPVWNPDEPQAAVFRDQWTPYDPDGTYPNGFRAQWEQFIRHLYDAVPWPYTLREGVKGVELAEAALESSRRRAWVDLDRNGP
ncbi:MAG: Gfo/Idh/MocA family oxidoreductase [Vicinamibacterales bacterium]|jgi:predicted dehydrogenase|nr:oxidoreductase [Acidobacteriota bacterium]MDP7472101.1 Gfo/Idh/MocA family oxidoreductase [Vicinamibacterales bacterium]MDP7673019.1 Gfo/Idh/MocA family oxidoreductase [Vicinamibacterales bacterium]HJO37280.1 Gfo/Idh/MocA family oxidoreductase [Vicinamibacterales bacterium]|tara:strand:+ start:4217 stop:5365 length:1149 start_codon:yes stop_codon:yes gene_type:complete